MVPDAELSVVGERVAKETTVVGGTWEGNGFVMRSIDNRFYLIAKDTCGRIEIDTTEVIMDRIELMTALWECLGRTEIERTPIGRKDGEGLVDRILLEQGGEQEFVFLCVVDLKVGGGIKDLDTVGAGAMEELTRRVGGISNVATRWMPIGIDAEAECLVGLGVVGS